ncbi:hypothetical protein DPMN_051050 [Dreissena polymorpha]|uniref:Uncharacterized protein n=1 Tax=Dreissena polymorpha TaxID=45954 RepID=A0A9D4HNN0_DREPO|nr:hypothetical protein DPMN_051050 [Dreissena polymorpha]
MHTYSGPANAVSGNPDTGSLRSTNREEQQVVRTADIKAYGKHKNKFKKAKKKYIKFLNTGTLNKILPMNSQSKQEMYKELKQSNYRIHVIPAQMFEDARRYGEINIFQLEYTYLHPASSSYVFAIPVYRNGHINLIDRNCNDNYN